MVITPIALILTGLAALGTACTIYKILDDYWNFQALRLAIKAQRAVVHGSHWWIATASLVSSIGQLCVWFGFLGIGVIVLSNTTTAPPERALRNNAILSTLISMEIVFAAIQVWQIAVRSRIRAPRMLTTVDVSREQAPEDHP